jgi:hypothetical protein
MGLNSLDWKVPYVIWKLLERKCLKWACMTHLSLHDPFEYLKHKLWSKEGLRVKLSISFPTTKSRESPCHIHWKSLNKGYNFALDFTSIEGLHTQLWASKVEEVPISKILGQNDIWVLASCPSTNNTIRGKVVASPKSGPWWVLWVHVCMWFVYAPKMSQLCTNQPIVWFV